MEVGKRYRHVETGHEATCLAVDGVYAWMKEADREGGWISVAVHWTEIREPREFRLFRIGDGWIVATHDDRSKTGIHVREVIAE